MVNVQTGNMLDVIVEGRSIGLKQRDSDHRKYDVIWLPEPESLALVLQAEILRVNPLRRVRAECTWKYDPDGYWQTQCGDQFVFSEGGPTENRVKFCHFCGKQMFESVYENGSGGGE